MMHEWTDVHQTLLDEIYKRQQAIDVAMDALTRIASGDTLHANEIDAGDALMRIRAIRNLGGLHGF